MFVWTTLCSVFKLLLVTVAGEANVAELEVIMWPSFVSYQHITTNRLYQIGYYSTLYLNDIYRNCEFGHQNAIL